MKILFVCKSLPPKVTGGIQTHVWKLSGWLNTLGHQVTILTAGSLRKGLVRRKEDGREIIELPYFPGRKVPYFGILAEEYSFNVAAKRWLQKNADQFDMVHLQGRSGFLFPAAYNPTPVVTTFHGILAVEHQRSGLGRKSTFSERLHRAWASRCERQSIQHSDRCIAVSQEMVHNMASIAPTAPNRTIILPNGVDIQEDSFESVSAASNQLVFVGRLETIKGIYPLVEAMEKVPAHVQLVMIGSGSEQSNLQKLIREKGLQDRIILAGAQQAPEVFNAIRKSFALVLPSYHETQGIVLLEANSCGKPVIASNIPGITEVVQHEENGLLTPVGDADALAKAIVQLHENPALAQAMGEKGKAVVEEKFSWRHIALETERTYGQVLASRKNKLPITRSAVSRTQTVVTNSAA